MSTSFLYHALGIPTSSDKLLQEVMRSVLEAYYEPQFSDHSHGFRPGLGCDTALQDISRHWKCTKWFIESDIKGCFDNIDHSVLLSILREKVHDNRFLRLLENMLKAGSPSADVSQPAESVAHLQLLLRRVAVAAWAILASH
jgi:retron-type reverse transcriptase